MKKYKILSFGEIIWDIYEDCKKIGGAPLNFAMHCAKQGLYSALISSVGNDELGNKALDIIKKSGIDTRYISFNDYSTGSCKVKLDENKVPSYQLMTNVAYDNITLSDDDISKIKNENYCCLSFGTLIQRSKKSADILYRLIKAARFNDIFCDVNLRKGNYSRKTADYCLKNATILKISLEEEPLLRDMGLYSANGDSKTDIANAVFNACNKLKVLILTDGANGAYSVSRKTGKLIFEPAKKVKILSTVGAGDSFGAAWIVSYLSGEPLEVCMKNAVTYSASIISGNNL